MLFSAFAIASAYEDSRSSYAFFKFLLCIFLIFHVFPLRFFRVFHALPNAHPQPPIAYTWDSLYDPQCIPKYNETSHEYYCKFMPPTYVSLWYLVMNFAIFGILTWYFDNVLPSAPFLSLSISPSHMSFLIGTHGEPRPLYFFLQPSYYGITTRGGKGCLPSGASSKKAAGTTRLMLNSDDDADDEDADATEEERLLMHSSKADREASASLYDDEDVRKEYHGVLRSERAAALKGNSSSSDDAAPIRIAGLGVTYVVSLHFLIIAN